MLNAAVNTADLCSFSIFIHNCVGWIQWVRAALGLAFHLGHICVVIAGETARVLPRLVSLLSTSPGDIIQFHWITRWSACHDVSFRPALVNVVNGHGVTDKLGRGGWSHLHFRNLIGGIQRVIALSLGLELDDLWLGT